MTIPGLPDSGQDHLIRPMLECDIEQIRAIDEQVYPVAWSEKLLRAEIGRDDRSHVVALSESGIVVGHAGLLYVEPEATLSTVAVDPGAQGGAIATSLLCHLFGEARGRGVNALTLEVRASNRRAQRLYYRFGFGPVGVRPRYYEPDKEDAVIMWAHDVGSPAYGERLALIASSAKAESFPSTRTQPRVTAPLEPITEGANHGA